MNWQAIEAKDIHSWRKHLSVFSKVDVCQMPEYHTAYSTRVSGAKPLLWTFQCEKDHFAYPFFLTPVMDTSYFDISSVYGYSGPLSTTTNSDFLKLAWAAFDEWSVENKVIAEFTRFSIYADTKENAHPQTIIESNRSAAVTYFPGNENEYMNALPAKTRNMIRKSLKSELSARKLDSRREMNQFRDLYIQTMDRNRAPDFFFYDDKYFDFLLSLPPEELSLYGVYKGSQLISAAIALIYKKGALYHLGASLSEYSALGAGNLVLFEMGKFLQSQGVEFLNLGGGRTTADTDSLYLFKRNNAVGVEKFYIGKRIVDPRAYQEVVELWQNINQKPVSSSLLLFYRS